MNISFGEVLILITTISGAIISTINAWRLKRVDNVVNGNFSMQRKEIARLQRLLDRLRAELAEIEESKREIK